MQRTEEIVATIGVEKTILISTETLSELLKLITSFINNSNDADTIEENINKSISDSALAIILLSHVFDRDKIISYIDDKINDMNVFSSMSKDKLLKFMLLKDTELIPQKQELLKDIVIDAICLNINIQPRELYEYNKVQKRKIVFVRQLIIYALRMLDGKKYKFTLSYVGSVFSKDHATASHAIKTINQLRKGGSAEEKSLIRFVDSYIIKLL